MKSIKMYTLMVIRHKQRIKYALERTSPYSGQFNKSKLNLKNANEIK